MHWLLDLLSEFVTAFVPWNSGHIDRSAVGESRMDREARGFGLVVLLVVVALVAAGIYWWG